MGFRVVRYMIDRETRVDETNLLAWWCIVTVACPGRKIGISTTCSIRRERPNVIKRLCPFVVDLR